MLMFVVFILAQPCSVGNKYYKHEETFMNDCNTCQCLNGRVTCTLIACGKKHSNSITYTNNNNIDFY